MAAQQFRLLYTELRHSSLQLVASDFESVCVSYWLARADFGVPVVAVNVQLVPEIERYLCITSTQCCTTLYTFVMYLLKYIVNHWKSRKENPQKLTQSSSRSHPRHLVGKRTAQKDITIDTTSDSQVNSNFPNRWSPASLTFNNYFYLFLYLYIT